MQRLEWIGFDADDTLWHNERLYHDSERDLARLLAECAAADEVSSRLLAVERRNLPKYGYGIKSFVLSMIETAIDIGGDRTGATTIGEILALGKRMLDADVDLLPGAADTVRTLSERARLVLVTKGDLRDQRAKLERSGLEPYFDHIEIVPEKTPETYAAILARLGVAADRFAMVGNSPRSDILPVLAVGAVAVHVPYPLLWAHEEVDGGLPPGVPVIDDLSALPAVLEELPNRT